MECPRCGSNIGSGKKFCIHCGCAVDYAQSNGCPEGQKGRKSKVSIWGLRLALIATLGIVVVYLFATGNNINSVLSGFLPIESGRTVYYGDKTALNVNLATQITVYAADDEPIANGGVQMIPQSGTTADADGYEILNLKKGGSFSLGDFSDIAFGTYCMRVFEGSQRKEAYEYSDIVVGPSSDSDSERAVALKLKKGEEGLKTVRYYGSEELKRIVNVSYKKEGQTQGYSNQWVYVQLTEESEDISSWSINQKLKSQFDNADEQARSWRQEDGCPLDVGYAQSVAMLDQLRECASIKYSHIYVNDGGKEVTSVSGGFYNIRTGDAESPESYFGLTKGKRNAMAEKAIDEYARKSDTAIDDETVQKIINSNDSYLVEASDLFVVINPNESGEAGVQLLPLGAGGVNAGS